jgi:Tol biopolymer transport system component
MRRYNRSATLALSVIVSGGPLFSQSTTRVSVDSNGVEGNNESHVATPSGDGRFIAFSSRATNLVAGDTNANLDVFVRDRLSGTTERVSVSTGGVQGSGASYLPSISPDGRFVAFASGAPNLVAGDTNGQGDIFVRDRLSGTTELVSVASGGAQANNSCSNPSISADGRFVAFESDASNLVANDTNGWTDVFVRDRLNGTTERVSVSSGGLQGDNFSKSASVSANGRFVAFESASSTFVAGDSPGGSYDIFVRDLQLGTTERVSVGLAGAEALGDSHLPRISADGRYVCFASEAANIVTGDTNLCADIFVYDRGSGTTERVSVDSGGIQGGQQSFYPSISADGRFVAFGSGSVLAPGDTNLYADIYVRDRLLGTTEIASVSTSGGQNNVNNWISAISADGRCVGFESLGTTLVAGDTNGVSDVFVRERGAPPPSGFCFGDGSAAACPCGNDGTAGRGCENSATTGGAQLTAAGSPALSGDTLVLTSAGELPSVSSIFLQGNAWITPQVFGDGLRCTGGALKRLYVHSASGGVVSAPQPGDASISARSAALGDAIGAGGSRYYQAYYRDPAAGFCASPTGNLWNVSSGLAVIWAQ